MNMRDLQTRRDEAMLRRHRDGGDTSEINVQGLAIFQALVDGIDDSELFQLGGESSRQRRKIYAPRKEFDRYQFGRDYRFGHLVTIDGEKFELVSVTSSPDSNPVHGFITLNVQQSD
jgi:hypothetical protein